METLGFNQKFAEFCFKSYFPAPTSAHKDDLMRVLSEEIFEKPLFFKFTQLHEI